MDYETDMHFLFPESKVLDSDRKTANNLISDKTKRDAFFNRSEYEESYDYGDMKWK